MNTRPAPAPAVGSALAPIAYSAKPSPSMSPTTTHAIENCPFGVAPSHAWRSDKSTADTGTATPAANAAMTREETRFIVPGSKRAGRSRPLASSRIALAVEALQRAPGALDGRRRHVRRQSAVLHHAVQHVLLG